MNYAHIDEIWADWFRRPNTPYEETILRIRLSTGVNRDQAMSMVYSKAA